MASYQEWLNKRFDEVYEQNSLHLVRDLNQMRLILFSDHHRGQRDGADDFQQCESVYLAALDYYWDYGFELVLIGDVEELWECRPPKAIAAYQNVLLREQVFADAPGMERYLRMVGNHDDIWYNPNEVSKHLGSYVNNRLVQEGIRLQVEDQGQTLGELFLIHGHQGTIDSDKYRKFSKWVVRNIWRPIQRTLRLKTNTPSNDFERKAQHEHAMYNWASQFRGRVVIAGHTHHPVWEGLSYEQALEQRIDEVSLDASTEVGWINDQIGGRIQLPGEKPFYFNTGCCSFRDATITGLELEDGEIRLIRWGTGGTPGTPAAPERTVVFTAPLADILNAVA